MKKRHKIWLWWSVFTILVAIFFLIVVGGLARQVRNYYLTFLRVADVSTEDLISTFERAWADKEELSEKENLVFLILGTDSLEYRPGDKVMTDTMMLANLNLKKRQLNLLSLPRDIFVPPQDMKINALYNEALQAGSAYPERVTAQYLSEWLEIPIDGAFVFTIDQVKELIDLAGGIEVDVQKGFIDEMYPRDDVDVTVVRDPALLYETIQFAPGLQTMDGETATKFMRSRHATGSEGSDLARAARQQLVVSAFVSKLSKQILDERTLFNFVLLGNLYKFYENNYERYLPLHLAGGIALEMGTADFSQALPKVTQNVLSVYPIETEGVLVEATPEEMARDYYGAWVWKIRDLTALKDEVKVDLGLSSDPSAD